MGSLRGGFAHEDRGRKWWTVADGGVHPRIRQLGQPNPSANRLRRSRPQTTGARPMSIRKSYDGYHSFQYLTEGVDYRPFALAKEFDRVERR